MPATLQEAIDKSGKCGVCMQLLHGQINPPGEVTIYISSLALQPNRIPMTPLVSRSRPNGAALGVRWLVLVTILFGTIISSIGSTGSHGLAVIAAALHIGSSFSVESHGHEHEDRGGELAMVNQSAGADHPHHGTDHSHDKAHALPVAWSSAVPQLPGWWVLVRPWIEMVEAYRLERPPIG